MRVFIAGIDGYLGWALALDLLQHGYEVAGADNFARRRWVEEVGSCSAVVIASIAPVFMIPSHRGMTTRHRGQGLAADHQPFGNPALIRVTNATTRQEVREVQAAQKVQSDQVAQRSPRAREAQAVRRLSLADPYRLSAPK